MSTACAKYEKSRKPFENCIFTNLRFGEIKNLENVGPDLERRAPENDESSLNEISKILNMRSISIKKHEMGIW